MRTSRFFPEADDNKERRESYADDKLKVNESFYQRMDLQDVVDAHLLAIENALSQGFDRFIISATLPFKRADVVTLDADVAAVVEKNLPKYKEIYTRKGWQMLPAIDRVYDNYRARSVLGWTPQYTFKNFLGWHEVARDYCSSLTSELGVKGFKIML